MLFSNCPAITEFPCMGIKCFFFDADEMLLLLAVNKSIMKEKLEAFGKVLQTMDELRSHCPWDKKQTMETLRSLTIEETYELADAILSDDMEKIPEELGDLLLHIVFYARIGEEQGFFDISAVCHGLVNKLVERHPHIYGNVEVRDDEEVKENWEKIKIRDGRRSTLAGVPKNLPSMIKAIRIQEKVRGVGFDWDHKEQVWEKLNEELNEFHDAMKEDQDPDKMEEEFGDILFSLVNYARFFKINPDTALEKCNNKFMHRFHILEKLIQEDKKDLKNMALEEMEEYWQKAKRHNKG
jgi:XTP/dITP diphosphohydrolase